MSSQGRKKTDPPQPGDDSEFSNTNPFLNSSSNSNRTCQASSNRTSSPQVESNLNFNFASILDSSVATFDAVFGVKPNETTKETSKASTLSSNQMVVNSNTPLMNSNMHQVNSNVPQVNPNIAPGNSVKVHSHLAPVDSYIPQGYPNMVQMYSNMPQVNPNTATNTNSAVKCSEQGYIFYPKSNTTSSNSIPVSNSNNVKMYATRTSVNSNAKLKHVLTPKAVNGNSNGCMNPQSPPIKHKKMGSAMRTDSNPSAVQSVSKPTWYIDTKWNFVRSDSNPEKPFAQSDSDVSASNSKPEKPVLMKFPVKCQSIITGVQPKCSNKFVVKSNDTSTISKPMVEPKINTNSNSKNAGECDSNLTKDDDILELKVSNSNSLNSVSIVSPEIESQSDGSISSENKSLNAAERSNLNDWILPSLNTKPRTSTPVVVGDSNMIVDSNLMVKSNSPVSTTASFGSEHDDLIQNPSIDENNKKIVHDESSSNLTSLPVGILSHYLMMLCRSNEQEQSKRYKSLIESISASIAAEYKQCFTQLDLVSSMVAQNSIKYESIKTVNETFRKWQGEIMFKYIKQARHIFTISLFLKAKNRHQLGDEINSQMKTLNQKHVTLASEFRDRMNDLEMAAKGKAVDSSEKHCNNKRQVERPLVSLDPYQHCTTLSQLKEALSLKQAENELQFEMLQSSILKLQDLVLSDGSSGDCDDVNQKL